MNKRLLTLDVLVEEIQAGRLMVECRNSSFPHYRFTQARKDIIGNGLTTYSIISPATSQRNALTIPIGDMGASLSAAEYLICTAGKEPKVLCSLLDILTSKTITYPPEATGPIEPISVEAIVQLSLKDNTGSTCFSQRVKVNRDEVSKIVSTMSYLQGLGLDVSVLVETAVKH